MVPSRMVGGMSQSSSSGVFFQGDCLSQVAGNSQLGSTFGNPSNSLPGLARANTVPVSVGDLSNTVINSVASSGPSIGESSLVTGSNSGISGGPQFQRSVSMNNESYMRLPTSPMSFSSNNISISGSSLIDGSSVVQRSSNQDQVSRQAQRNQQIQGATSVTSLPSPSQMGPVQLLGNSPRGSSTFMQDPVAISQLQKKPRLDIKQEDIMQQQVLKQLLQRQDSGHLQSPNPQLQALIQQQRRQQEQQLLQSMSPMQRVQFLQQQQQQQQQLQLRQRVQGMQQSAAGIKRPFDGGVCSRRLMQYLYHQRQRPVENAIAYWRKFVAEYYSPRAKKRWCLSQYDNAGNHSLGVFPQASQDPWQCDICGSKSGRGFEATFEVLPRLNEIKFGSGVIDELLFLDLPREYRFPTGMMVLEYAKAVQESVYEQLRVVREGQLRILFTPELKILSWEFCARRHEELLPRRVVTPQVNQLLQVAQKCQSTISESGPDGVPQQDLQANSAMVVAAGRQLAKSLELQSLNDLGFSKRYVRCLQIADVVNSMKDLIDFCREQKLGPTEGLKNFPRRTSEPKPQMAQEMDPTGNIHGLPTDHNTLNKLMSLHPGLNINNNHLLMANRGALSGSAALANYQNSLMRQNSMNSTHNIPVKQEQSSGLSTSSQAALANYQNSLMRQNSMNPAPNIPVKQEPSSGLSSSSQALPSSSTSGPSSGGVLQNTTLQQSSNSQAPSSQLKGSTTASVNGPQLQSQSLPSTQGGQALQQRMMQQLLQDMNRKGNTFSQQSPSLQNPSGNIVGDGFAFRSSQATTNGPGNVGNIIPSRNNSFKSGSNSESHSSAAVGYNGFNTKSSDLSQNVHSSDAAMIDQDNSISQFADSFFYNDLDEFQLEGMIK